MTRINVRIDLSYEALGPSTFMLNVLPARTPRQRVVEESVILPRDAQPSADPPGEGARCIRFFSGPGPVSVRSSFTVDVMRGRSALDERDDAPLFGLPMSAIRYLQPSRYCESDRLSDFAKARFGSVAARYQPAHTICEWVRDNMEVSARPDSADVGAYRLFARGDGTGRDLAHLMIALCRALGIPARLTSVIPFGVENTLQSVAVESCVEAFVGGRWHSFDPGRRSAASGLICLASGRDAADVAFARIYGQVRASPPAILVRVN